MKMLSELLPDIQNLRDVPVTGLADDSRRVGQGCVFLAAPGQIHDARQYIADVVSVAAAVICEPPSPITADNIIELPDLNSRKGEIAARFYGDPSAGLTTVAVTGTNGKTSCAHFMSQALTAAGCKAGVMGTLGFGFPGELRDAGLTTPDALECQRQLSALAEGGAEAVVLEASSHGLAQGRLNGTHIDIAVLTNVTHDHLDYHETFAEYRRAKRRLFEWQGLKAAVVNADDPHGSEFAAACGRDTQVVWYSTGSQSADVCCRGVSFSMAGMEAEITTPWGDGLLKTPLLGEFNLSNLLAVVSVLGLLGYEFEQILKTVAGLTNVRGRMDQISQPGEALVVIDYAHTPDALEKVLQAIRRHCEGELWCVFGCGGNRDADKRPAMGKIASRLADRVIVTSDNPRYEHADRIIADIVEGVSARERLTVNADRSAAIRFALTHASAEDVVLIAGKGHEEYQETEGQRHFFSDHEQVSTFFSTRGV
ncbi:MAG: UDP-N-acetylmuramoyl-L-alanyl-D-glutamate--2,6-diaminopimelate ligase [Pseudomonadales bacterium]|nr:UDP-N-acetylmuramoyl-L-alanyl-D-glutamate--2,6-diaminopimelate ligase [Pseudomonadales bacterium]